MKRYHYLESTLGKMVLALFLAASLLLCRDAQISMELLGLKKAQLLFAGLTGALGLGFLICNRREWRALLCSRRIAVVLISALVLFVPMAVKRDWQLMYFSVFFCIVCGVLLTYFVSLEQVSKYYVLILSVLAVYSVLTTYFLRILPDRGMLNVPIFTNDREVEFYNFGLSYVSVSYVKNRNFGIFREPGVYQYFLLLGVYLTNDVVRWRRLWAQAVVNTVLAVTMLTTFATGGYVELGLLYAFFFLDKKLYRDRRALRWLLAAGLAAGALAAMVFLRRGVLYGEIYDMFIGKFEEGGDSGGDRINSILLNLGAFLRSPLVGEKIYPVLHALENNTSSSTVLLAILGIGGGVLHGLGWLALVWRKERGIVRSGMILVILAMSFNTENMITDVFLWLMPVMALTEWTVQADFGKVVKHGTGSSAQAPANPDGDCPGDQAGL